MTQRSLILVASAAILTACSGSSSTSDEAGAGGTAQPSGTGSGTGATGAGTGTGTGTGGGTVASGTGTGSPQAGSSTGAGNGGGPGGCMGTACNPDPCAGVTCSAHGTCAASGGTATCTCDAGYQATGLACIASGGVFGMTVPTGHPRLVFNADNLAAAKAWYTAHPFQPDTKGGDIGSLALKGLLADDAASCTTAVGWAITESSGKSQTLDGYPYGGIEQSGTACDDCRWNGEAVLQVYDWCYNLMSAGDRTSLETSIDQWIEIWRQADWGGVPMHENNYYWGYLRNEFEWGILRSDTSPTLAKTELDDVFNVRLKGDFYPAAGVVGGIGQEGAQYGPYVLGYASIPLLTASQMGRDVFGEGSYYLGGVYAYVYETTPDKQLFTWNDNDGSAPSDAHDGFIVDYMTTAATNWSSAPVGGHAAQWLTNVGDKPDLYLQALNPKLPTAVDFTGLPLDYFAAGPRYLFGRSSWSASSSTAFMLMLGDEDGVGHNHIDYGSFQIWRGGEWLSRESVGYGGSGVSVVGLGGKGSSDISDPVAHNTVAVGTAEMSGDGSPKVTRLESQGAYSFSSVDLSSNFKNTHVERDFVFVRDLETMVVFDRGSNVFLAHCEKTPTVSGQGATCTNGSQALVVSSLVGSPSVKIVSEGGDSGQNRIEITTTAVGGDNVMVTVMQAKDASAAALTPTLVDNGTSYTVTLNSSVSIEFEKGAMSSGGSITIGGTKTPFRADVEGMTLTTSGPVWQ